MREKLQVKLKRLEIFSRFTAYASRNFILVWLVLVGVVERFLIEAMAAGPLEPPAAIEPVLAVEEPLGPCLVDQDLGSHLKHLPH